MNLTKQEQQAIDWLYDFAAHLRQGESLHYTKPVIDQLQRMGISIEFISHKDVATLKRGKDEPFQWEITNAPWYIKGKRSMTYLPFQVKELKEAK
jgi:hypothetical protein